MAFGGGGGGGMAELMLDGIGSGAVGMPLGAGGIG